MIIGLILTILILYILLWYLFPLARGAIYDPSEMKEVKTMVELSKVRHGEKAVDLGSGDGRIVIALAKKGAEAHGYEINPILVYKSRQNIKYAGLKHKAFIHWKSFWDVDLSDFDIVTTFQVGFIMKKLENKLMKELKPGSYVISHHWTFPTLPALKHKDDIYLYQIPEVIEL